MPDQTDLDHADARTGSPPRPTDSSDATVSRSVGRALDLLEIVLGAPHNLTAAAHACRLTPTTALRHLRALEARGYVERDGANTYSAGPTLLRIAASLHDGGGELDRLVVTVQPHLDRLAALTRESCYLVVSDGRVASYVATAESDRAIRHVGWIGQTVTLDGTAVGEALRKPGRVATRTGAVESDITAISLALPTHQTLDLAISIIGPAHRFKPRSRAAHQAALRTTVEALSRQLGRRPEVVAS